MKHCPVCGRTYPDNTFVCPIDQQPLGTDEPLLQPAPAPQRHSSMGIASFGISVAVGILMFAFFVVAAIFYSRMGRSQPASNPAFVVLGLVALFLLAVDLLAVGLGIAAICQSQKKRLFGILGLVFSACTILGTIGLIIVGRVAGH